jgi:antitoxin HicB
VSEFPYRIVVRWSDADEAFVAEVPALPGAGGDGATPGDAVREAESSARAQLDARKHHGDPVPPPDCTEAQFSGQIRLRMPKSLHRELAAAAEEEGVSLNQLMVTYLALQLRATQDDVTVSHHGAGTWKGITTGVFRVGDVRSLRPTGSRATFVSYGAPKGWRPTTPGLISNRESSGAVLRTTEPVLLYWSNDQLEITADPETIISADTLAAAQKSRVQ